LLDLPSLRAHSHLLSRVLLAILLAVKESGQIKTEKYHLSSRRIELLINFIFRLHGDPLRLFFSCFTIELRAIRNLAILLRARSMAVRVAQHIWTAFPTAATDIVTPLVLYCIQFDARKLAILTTNVVGEERERVANRLLKCLQDLLCVEKIPHMICVLCHRCTLAVEAVEMDGVYQSKRHWAVSLLIFRHYIIPTFNATMYSQFPIVSEQEQKRIILMERLLHKLAFRRFFEFGPCVLNDVLVDCCALYDTFCEKVLAVGKTVDMAKVKNSLSFEGQLASHLGGFCRFFNSYEKEIRNVLREMIKIEKVTCEDEVQLFLQLKMELTKFGIPYDLL
jgi:hypothetical protein